MNIRPMDDRVIVQAVLPETKSKGGIALVAELDKQVPLRGKIVAVGPGRRAKDGTVVPLDVNVGDIAIFEQNVACEITVDGEKMIVVRESDILVVLSK